MTNIIETRIKKVRESLIKKNIDTLMISSAENRRYLSGFTASDTQIDESAGVLFITRDKAILATDSRYQLQAENEKDSIVEVYCHEKNLIAELPDILKKLKTYALGFESCRISYFTYEKIIESLTKNRLNIELFPTKNIVEDLRIIKEESEIETIKKALHIAELAFEKFMKKFNLGMSEKEAAWMLEEEIRKESKYELSFPIIAAFGPNAAMPHAIASDRKSKTGEPLLFDWGVKAAGYCSDISKTFIIGKADDIFKKVFKAVLEAGEMAIELIKPGVSSNLIDKAARDHIDDMGFKGKFGHGVGHGVGLNVHESPRINSLSDTTLKEGMVFTIEPGIYIDNWGGVRLEKMVLVTKDGVELLNKTDFTLKTLA